METSHPPILYPPLHSLWRLQGVRVFALSCCLLIFVQFVFRETVFCGSLRCYEASGCLDCFTAELRAVFDVSCDVALDCHAAIGVYVGHRHDGGDPID